MPHTRTNWMNYSPPAINAANLLNMEDGIWYGLAHSGGVRNTAEFLDRNPASTTGGLAEAITDLGGSPGVVFAAPHNHPINVNYPIPATVHLMAGRGATFTVANGITLTINGTVGAGAYQIFSGAGTVSLGSEAKTLVFSDWFGVTFGNVGIGETDIESRLHVVSSTVDDDSGAAIFEKDFDSGSSASYNNVVAIWGRDTADYSAGVGPMLVFGFRDDESDPNMNDYRAGIGYEYDGQLTFHTKSGATIADFSNERMRIDGSGNVGIGTVTPTGAKLVIDSGSGDTILTESDVNYSFVYSTIAGAAGIALNNLAGALAFGVGGAERLRIDTSGNVGIGVTDPDALLEVAGTTHFGVPGAVYTWPGADGNDGQFLKTNGAGTLIWTDAPAGVGGDHGGLAGLADDDHTQYLLVTGLRAGSTVAAQSFGATGIATDVIAESTGGAGVTIDGALLKDYEAILKGPIHDVRAYGAKTDQAQCYADEMQAAFDAAASTRGTALIPNGTWRIDKSLILRYNTSVMGVGQTTIIKPTTNHFPAFVNNPSAATYHFSVKNMRIDFSNLGSPSSNANDCGFKFTGWPTNYPYFFRLENIFIYYAYYGYYDTSGSFMSTLSRIWTKFCRNGFHKSAYGTTMHFENCYAEGNDNSAIDGYGWYIEEGLSYTMTSCAVDKFYGVAAAYFLNTKGLTINGFDFESNQTETNYNSIIYFKGCKGLTVTGLVSNANHLHTVAGKESYLVRVENCTGKFEGMDLSRVGGDDVDGGGINGYTFVIIGPGTSFLEIAGSRIQTLNGGGALTGNRYALWSSAPAGSSIVEIGCELANPQGGILRGDINDTMCRVMGATGVEDT